MAKKKNKRSENYFPFNSRLDRELVMAENYEIHAPYGLRVLSQYLNDVELRQKGVSLEEIGIKQRRDNSLSYVYDQTGVRLESVKEFFDDDAEETESNGETEKNEVLKIAVVQINGVMRMEDGLSSSGIRSICNQLQNLSSHSEIGAIILECNTGGGEKTAGQHLYNTVLDISTNTPVFAYGHFIGSACVRGTLPCAEIWMSGESSMFGSIGSMAQINKKFKKFFQKNVDEIYSRKSVEKNHEWREYLQGNKGAIMDKLDISTTDFHDAVQRHRKLNPAMLESTLRGDVFPATEAKTRGLIEGVGTLKTVIERAVDYINNSQSLKDEDMTKEKFEAFKSTMETAFGVEFKAENAEDLQKEIAAIKPVTEQVKEAETAATETATKEFSGKIEKLTKVAEALEAQKATKKESVKTSETDKKLDALLERFEKLEGENTALKSEKTELQKKVAEKKATTAATTNESTTDAPAAVKNLTGINGKAQTEAKFEW